MNKYRNESQWAPNEVFHSNLFFPSISSSQFFFFGNRWNAYWDSRFNRFERFSYFYISFPYFHSFACPFACSATILIFIFFNFSPHEWWSSLNTHLERACECVYLKFEIHCPNGEVKWREEKKKHILSNQAKQLKTVNGFIHFSKRRLMENRLCTNERSMWILCCKEENHRNTLNA